MPSKKKREELSRLARLAIVEKSREIGGVHIGGSFSCIDFLVAYYSAIFCQLNTKERHLYYDGKLEVDQLLVMSKGHCYIAQLAVLDIIFGQKNILAITLVRIPVTSAIRKRR